MRRFAVYLWPLIGLSAVIFSSWLLFRQINGLSIADVGNALAAITPLHYVMGGLSTLIAYVVLSWYDRLGLEHLQRKLPPLFVGLTSFTAYALSHNIGLSFISSAVIRYRAYSTRGLSLAEVAVLAAFSSFTFGLGAVLLGGIILAVEPQIVMRLFDLPIPLVRTSGFVMLALVAAYVGGSLLHLPPLIINRFRLAYPNPRLAAQQLLLGPLEIMGAAGIIYFALPEAANPGYFTVLGIFLASFSVALLSHAPGGLGVLEFVFVTAMPEAPHGPVIAALLVFRIFYLLVPLALGIAMVVLFERSRAVKGLDRAPIDAEPAAAKPLPAGRPLPQG